MRSQNDDCIPWGATSSVGRLEHVLVKPPGESFGKGHPGAGFVHPVDLDLAVKEHDAFSSLLGDLGVIVHEVPGESPSPDVVYQYDTSLVTDRGAILLRSGKPTRVGEEDLQAAWYEAHGIPIAGRIEAPGTVDGGDVCWVRGVTCVGRSLRTNQAGIDQLVGMLDGDVRVFDMPYDTGEAHCLHLMSVISPITDDLVLVELERLPSGLFRMLEEMGVTLVAVPREEVDSLGCNVLVVRPGVVVMVEGNPRTRAELESHGIEVHTFQGTEIALNGNGGPTCLTKPVRRG